MFGKIRIINKYKLPFKYSVSNIARGIIPPGQMIELTNMNIEDNTIQNIDFEVAANNIDSETAGEIAMAALEGRQYKPWVEIITGNYIYLYDKQQFIVYPGFGIGRNWNKEVIKCRLS